VRAHRRDLYQRQLFGRQYDDLSARYEGSLRPVFSTRMLYALSSGTSHSAQYAMAAMLKAAATAPTTSGRHQGVGERAHP
jgi:hypothetical protein